MKHIAIALIALSVTACGDPLDERPLGIDTTDTRSKSLLELTSDFSELTRFRLALEATGIADRIGDPARHTFFAPVDEGFFANMPLDSAFAEDRIDTLKKVVSLHIARGSIEYVEEGEQIVSTLADQPVTLERRDGALRVDGRRVLRRLLARDGVLYVIPNALNLPAPDTLEAMPDPLLDEVET